MRMLLLISSELNRVALLLFLPACIWSSMPTGMFQTRCLERHFFLSVKSSFLGPNTRFDFEDQDGLHLLSDQEATRCGYMVMINDAGDLLFRASFLACHVQTKTLRDFWLHLWFVNLQADGKVVAYPFQLHCSLQGQLKPREIVCEENYMEVSIYQPAIAVTSKTERGADGAADLHVMFHIADLPTREARILSLKEAAALGYHISLHGSHLTLRCPYSSPLSYFIKERGVDLEILRATVLYRLQSDFLAVDVTAACPLSDAAADRSDLLWTVPYILSPLVYVKLQSHGLLAVTLGVFAADVSLQKLTMDGGGDLLTWTYRNQTQLENDLIVSKLSHFNGSHSYRISFLMSHPKIIPEYIGEGFKTYSLSFTFTLVISPSGSVFYHQASLEQSVEHKAPASPKLEGKCTESSLLVLLHHGAQAGLQWELFLGVRKLDWELVEMAGIMVEAEEDYLTVEFPLHSPVMNHGELTLKGLVSGVAVSVVDADSLNVMDHLVHECTFPVREFLLCLPEGRMVAVVDTTHTIPPTSPNRTRLLDPGCVPMETDGARALFSFSVNSCGTTVTTEGSFLVYENQISYRQDFLPLEDALIHRDSPYRLTIKCQYPVNESRTVDFHHPFNSSLGLLPALVKRTRREAANTSLGKGRATFEG
ncbi:uncharacterized protein LOC121504188 isoform X5 [Cheilinus undulatus]|uniref:uncharacterized protein LOC121504188 isoform X5 n=1 Tax=Cheilinus undulatus TaxID=241271 RepID=UPI001BD5FA04|nr:uncharacterized protein LOC121504188 isoform X5 [Cheilinus undulatus]